MKIKKIIAAAAAVMTALTLTACGDKTPDAGEASESTSEGSFTTADISGLLDNGEDTSSADTEEGEIATFATVTDVENEVDRAIYKTQFDMPDGWTLVQDTDQGKLYASASSSLKVQAANYGADAELTDLDTMAEGAAASIKVTNMYYQADTDFADPQHLTVAGQDCVRYDYTVTAYLFTTDDEGNKTGEKEVAAIYKDRLYALYNGTDSYYLMFETAENDYDRVAPEWDKIVESFSIAEDGTAGYESASVFMSESLDAYFSQLEEAEAAAEETTEALEETTEDPASE